MVAMCVVLALAGGAGEWGMIEKTDVFTAGENGYAMFRVPGICRTANGVLLAYCEARRRGRGDWGTIDIWMRRSTDGGKTWLPARKIVAPPADARPNEVAIEKGLAKPDEVTCNNVVAIADREPGVVHVLYCIEYARCFYMRSEDDGETFSQPTEITGAFEAFRDGYDWRVLAAGPGHGIQLRTGRLVVPVWLSDGTGGHGHRPSVVATVFSDDGGKRWRAGEIIVRDPEPRNPSETVVVELADGRVMLNFRNESPRQRRGVVIGPDGATGWGPWRFDEGLSEPTCMGSIFRVTLSGPQDRNRIVFANPHNAGADRRENDRESHARRDVTVRLSYDEGETWPVARVLERGPGGYTDLAAAPDGTVWCIYERGAARGNHYHPAALTVARFDLVWLAGEGAARD